MSGIPDLSALNPVERRFLLLLAQGHTVKSIAVRESCTVGAVNERLREARRKTGLGSSREVARAVLAQENRDEQIGVAMTGDPAASVGPQAASPAQRRWIMPMLAVGGAAALAFVLTLVVPSTAPQSNPTAGLPQDLSEPFDARFARAIEAEPRDPVWAIPTEAALQNRFAEFPGLSDVRVRCATTLCEVKGILSADVDRTRDTMRDLQSPPLVADLGKFGLKSRVSSFASTKDQPRRGTYASYWMRSAEK